LCRLIFYNRNKKLIYFLLEIDIFNIIYTNYLIITIMSFTLQDISNAINVVPNFPKDGIMFRDISELLLNNKLFNFVIDEMAKLVKKYELKPDYIAGFESRGFLFRELASKLECGFVMIRKPNKLPNSITIEYEKEYGTDSLSITNCIPKNSNVLLIDDLIATGGTVYGGYQLIKAIECNPIGCINLIELIGLNVNENLLQTKIPILSLLKYYFDSNSLILDKILNVNLSIINYVPIKNSHTENTIVFCHPSIDSLANNYITSHPDSRKGVIIWDQFPDTQPNITFESMEQLENKDIVFFLSLYDTSILFQQLSMLMVLPRQFINSLNIYITYFSVGTMERVDKEGMLATAETMAKIISNCIEITKTNKPVIHIWDIHALPIRFYFNSEKVIIKLHSGIPLLTNNINANSIIVFPDDGACKRFKHFFSHFKIIVCSKVREGNNRIIKITDKLNFPDNEEDVIYDEMIIIDDLVQSGGTLIKCKETLEKLGYKNISAYVTHSVFPNNGWNKIINSNFHKFYTTNSIPEVTDKLVNKPQFQIFNLFESNNNSSPNIIYVATHNIQKLQAVYDSFSKNNKHIIIKGVNVSSNIHEQPIGINETREGCKNRLYNLIQYLKLNNIKYDHCISIENGIRKLENNEDYEDFCYIIMNNKYNQTKNEILEIVSTCSNPIVPLKYVDMCIEKNQNITIGQIIQNKTGIPKDNWHQYFNDDKKTRVDIICATLNKMLNVYNPYFD
jgi:adenine phosphoribosyltransferase